MQTFTQQYQFDTIGEIPHSITYHPDQYCIAVGFDTGIIRVFGNIYFFITLTIFRYCCHCGCGRI